MHKWRVLQFAGRAICLSDKSSQAGRPWIHAQKIIDGRAQNQYKEASFALPSCPHLLRNTADHNDFPTAPFCKKDVTLLISASEISSIR
jgi:hypothetical protein